MLYLDFESWKPWLYNTCLFDFQYLLFFCGKISLNSSILQIEKIKIEDHVKKSDKIMNIIKSKLFDILRLHWYLMDNLFLSATSAVRKYLYTWIIYPMYQVFH